MSALDEFLQKYGRKNSNNDFDTSKLTETVEAAANLIRPDGASKIDLENDNLAQGSAHFGLPVDEGVLPRYAQAKPATPSSALKSGQIERELSSPKYYSETEDNLVKDALSAPKSPEYYSALEKEKEERQKEIERIRSLKTKMIHLGNSAYFAPITDEDRVSFLDRYDLLGVNERAEDRLVKENVQKEKIQKEILDLTSELGYTKNDFKKTSIAKELKNKQAELAALSGTVSDSASAVGPSVSSQGSAEEILSDLEAGLPPKLSDSALERQVSSKPSDTDYKNNAVLNKPLATINGGPSIDEIKKEERIEDLSKSLGDQTARKISEYEDLLARYKEAQSRRENLRFVSGLGQAAAKFGAAMLGAKAPDAAFWQNMQKRGEAEPDLLKEEVAFKQSAEELDPNSEISRQYQDMAKMLGIKITGKETARVLKEKLPMLERFKTGEENRKSREQTFALQKMQIDADKEKARQAKLTTDQNSYLERASARFAKDKVHEALFILKDAKRAVDAYLKNPDPTTAQSLAYAYAKVNDPNSVVRESELKLFGKAGSLYDRFKQTFELAAEGTIPAKKAKEFGDFIFGKISSAEQDLKTKLSPIVEGGKRRGINLQDTIEGVAGAEYYKQLYGEEDSSEKPKPEKTTVNLKQKLSGKAGKPFTDIKTGKRYVVNPDEISATEL